MQTNQIQILLGLEFVLANTYLHTSHIVNRIMSVVLREAPYFMPWYI